jgi:hypothetical protein
VHTGEHVVPLQSKKLSRTHRWGDDEQGGNTLDAVSEIKKLNGQVQGMEAKNVELEERKQAAPRSGGEVDGHQLCFDEKKTEKGTGWKP